MKNLELEYDLSDKFLMKIQKELKNNNSNGFICSENCPLLKTRYAGICISWMDKVLGSRNIVDNNGKYMPRSCRELFNYVFKYALDINKKQNKI